MQSTFNTFYWGGMKISALRANPFPPFGQFEIEFPHLVESGDRELAEVHMITGPNGSGKTRLLTLISGSLGSYRELQKRNIGMHLKNFNGIATDESLPFPSDWKDMGQGSLIDRKDTPAMTFCPRAYLETAEVSANAVIREPTVDDALSFSRPADESQRLLQGIFTMDLQGATEMKSGKVGRYSKIIKGLEEAVKSVTGLSFTFVSKVHPKPELCVSWGTSGEVFEITTLPDGLRSILGWLVQGAVWMDLFHADAPDPLNEPVILLVDEPETHLHPEWQWRVLPMMQKLFPKAQIFVATHSPFVVSSLNENAWIHRLKVGEGGKVFVEEAREVEKGDSYLTALTEVLGITGVFDPENQGLLDEFKALRSAALQGGEDEEAKLMAKAEEIAARGMELGHIIGAELRQYERQKEQKGKANAAKA